MRRRANGLITLCLLLLAACSAGGSRHVTSIQPLPLLPPHPSLRLQVNPVVGESQELLPDIRAALLAQLLATGRFSQVVTYEGPTDLLMTVEVVKVAKVTVTERVFLGALAGRNRVGVNVRIIDPATGITLKSYDAEGDSAAEILSAQAGLGDAIGQVARQVAEGAALGN
jgi:hypothetical protein